MDCLSDGASESYVVRSVDVFAVDDFGIAVPGVESAREFQEIPRDVMRRPFFDRMPNDGRKSIQKFFDVRNISIFFFRGTLSHPRGGGFLENGINARVGVLEVRSGVAFE